MRNDCSDFSFLFSTMPYVSCNKSLHVLSGRCVNFYKGKTRLENACARSVYSFHDPTLM